MRQPNGPGPELTALLIAPDRALAEELTHKLAEGRAFQVVADLRSYPPRQTLEIRLRQFAPEVVLLDVASDFAAAAELIRCLSQARPPVHVVGLHSRSDPEILLAALRAGATEFLYAPFDAAAQREAALRIRRLRHAEPEARRDPGKLVTFASAKPGSGASTLASQTAFALRRMTGQRVLLVDFDFMGATTSFYLGVQPARWPAEPGGSPEFPWAAAIEQAHGLEVLPAPEVSAADPIEASRLHDFCEYARSLYDWVILDLPPIFHRLSLLALSECDQGFMVTGLDLPSLHMARKAVQMLGQLGFARERFQILVNRSSKADGLRISDLEKVINCPAHASFPNDHVSIERMLTLGRPLDPGCELGRAIEEFAGRLSGVSQSGKKRSPLALNALPVFSQGT